MTIHQKYWSAAGSGVVQHLNCIISPATPLKIIIKKLLLNHKYLFYLIKESGAISVESEETDLVCFCIQYCLYNFFVNRMYYNNITIIIAFVWKLTYTEAVDM